MFSSFYSNQSMRFCQVTPEEMAMAMRHGLNLEEGEGVVEEVDWVPDVGVEEEQLVLQQGGGHNIHQGRSSVLMVEGSRRSSYLEEQALLSK